MGILLLILLVVPLVRQQTFLRMNYWSCVWSCHSNFSIDDGQLCGRVIGRGAGISFVWLVVSYYVGRAVVTKCPPCSWTGKKLVVCLVKMPSFCSYRWSYQKASAGKLGWPQCWSVMALFFSFGKLAAWLVTSTYDHRATNYLRAVLQLLGQRARRPLMSRDAQ